MTFPRKVGKALTFARTEVHLYPSQKQFCIFYGDDDCNGDVIVTFWFHEQLQNLVEFKAQRPL